MEVSNMQKNFTLRSHACSNGPDINDAMHMCINLKGRIRMGLVPFERERASGHAKHSSPKDENGES
jgi:hypothetical protein